MTGTGRERAVEALATTLFNEFMSSAATAVEVVQSGLYGDAFQTFRRECSVKDAAMVLDSLPPGWRLVHEEDVAQRLHEECIDTIARREAARPGGQYTQHMPDAHLPEARRLLGQDGGGE